jgi:hypothetical protein
MKGKMIHHVVWWIGTNVLEELAFPIFRVEESFLKLANG